MAEAYLFKSARLGFRNWQPTDIPLMAAINADPVVMEFFPSTNTYEQTEAFVTRMQNLYAAKGYCYFAVDRLDTGEFIGFIGLADQSYDTYFTPCTDIGWRLATQHWHNGFATEGAKRCLAYAFTKLHLHKVYAVAPKANRRSEKVMQNIGMHQQANFMHPLLAGNDRLQECVVYGVEKDGEL